MQTENKIIIDIGYVLAFVRRRLLWIFLAAVLCAAGGYAVSKYGMTPVYQASAIFVSRSSQEAEVVKDVVDSLPVYEAVVKELDLQETADQLMESVQMTSSTSSKEITIEVEDTDPEQAAAIAQALLDQAPAALEESFGNDGIYIVRKPQVSSVPVSPSVKEYTVVGGIFGFLAGLLIALILARAQDCFQDREKTEKILGYPVWGIVPLDPSQKRYKNRLTDYAYVDPHQQGTLQENENV